MTAVYALTDRGEALRPMLDGLALWGCELLPAHTGRGDDTRRLGLR